jgi:hypothetical protein
MELKKLQSFRIGCQSNLHLSCRCKTPAKKIKDHIGPNLAKSMEVLNWEGGQQKNGFYAGLPLKMSMSKGLADT